VASLGTGGSGAGERGITSLIVTPASPADLAAWIRGHWRIEALHHIRDVTRTLAALGLTPA
jgi:hypothetical protein